MSRWGKPKKNKRFINPRYYLEEKNEELLKEQIEPLNEVWYDPTSWEISGDIQDAMASVYLDDDEYERYADVIPTEQASMEVQRRRADTPNWRDTVPGAGDHSYGTFGLDIPSHTPPGTRGVTDEMLSQAQQEQYSEPYDWVSPLAFASETTAKPWVDDALEAFGRWAPRELGPYLRHIPGVDAISEPLARAIGGASQLAPFGMDALLFGYGVSTPTDPRGDWLANLNPYARQWSDYSTDEGAGDWGGSLGGTAGGLGGGVLGGPWGAAAGGFLGDIIGTQVGRAGRVLGQGSQDLWMRRPEILGGLTDEQLQAVALDNYYRDTGTGPYRHHSTHPQGQPGHPGSPNLWPDLPRLDPVPPPPQEQPLEETKMKKNDLLTETQIKRFKTLSNIKEEKQMLSESILGALGFLSAVLGGGLAAGYGLAKAQERGHLRGMSKWSGQEPVLQKHANRIRQRAKEQDPLMLDFVKELRANTNFRTLARYDALVQEFKDDPNVADIVEVLSYSTSRQEIEAALEQLQTYLESKSSEQNGEQI